MPSATHNDEMEMLSVVMNVFHGSTAGARPSARIASSASQRARLERISATTVVARSVHAPIDTTVCTTTIARRLRAASLASSRKPNGPGPARNCRLHTG